MKNIIKSLVIVVAVAAVASVATWAYFTDQEKVVNNTVAAGRLDIDIRPESGRTLPINISGLAPGECKEGTMLGINNLNTPVSTMAVKYRFYDEPVSESVSGFYDKLNVKVRHTFAGTPTPESWPVVYTGTLRDLLVDSTTTPGIISSSLAINNTHVYFIEICLDSSAGNAMQGANGVFNLVFDATQPSNPGWTE